MTWVLPKGTVEAGETIEQTALREVAEETGLRTRALEPLGSIRYVFVRDGRRVDKTVHFFLMEPVGGDLSLRDHEFAAVRWLPLDEAEALLSHTGERQLVSDARAAIDRHWPPPVAGMAPAWPPPEGSSPEPAG